MADIQRTLNEYRVDATPRQLIGVVEEVFRELFPTDTQVTCNFTRVEASIDLGETVRARVILDVDPVGGEPTRARISGTFSASGNGLRAADEPAIDQMARQVFEGVRRVITTRVREVNAFGIDRELG